MVVNTIKSSYSPMFYVFLVILFIVPWPHGLELTWEYLLFSVFISTLVGFVILKNDFQTFKQSMVPYKTTFYIFIALIFYGILQIVPMPNSWVEILNPNALIESDRSSILVDTELTYSSLSISPYTSFLELIKNTSYLIVFTLCLFFIRTKQQLIALLNTLFFTSAIIAVYSLLNHYTEGAYSIIGSIPPWVMPWKIVAHGTFSYQNHYASFLTLTIPLGLGLIHYYAYNQKNNGVKSPIVTLIINQFFSKNIIYFISVFIMVLALIETSSRGGNLVFIVSILYSSICYLLTTKQSKKKITKKLLKPIALLIPLLLILFLSGVFDKLTQRYEHQGLSPNGRDTMLITIKSIVTDFPIFGSGSGTYPVIQHQYKSPLLGNTAMSKRAHNDYLEILCNQGVIGLSLLFAAMIPLYLSLFRGLKKVKTQYTGIYLACFTSTSAILIHSAMDFNLHLPANAIYFFVILAAGLKINTISQQNRINKTSRRVTP